MPLKVSLRPVRAARGIALAAGMAGTALLAGCSNNPYPPGQTAQPVIYRAMTGDLRTLDPSVSYTVAEAAITDVIYPSYYEYHYLKRSPYVLQLELGAEPAKRAPYRYTVNEKGKTVPKTGEEWTFRIKPNLRFQDDPCFPGGKGRPITAADFVYSFRRMGDPSVACPVRSFVEDKILGFEEYLAHNIERKKQKLKADYAAPVEGLQLDPKDPYTFRIRLNQAYPQLRFLMAMHFTTPQAHEAVETYGKDLAQHCVGCGPYVMAEYTPKQRVVLQVNPNRMPEFYPTEGAPGDREAGLLADAGKPLPLAQTVIYTFLREGTTGWNLFQQGYLDQWGVTQENYQQVMARAGVLSDEMVKKGVQLHKAVTPNIRYYAFNMNDPVVGGYSPQKRKLRQAISTAMDAQAFIDLFDQGNGQRAQWIIPPGIPGYDPDYKNPYRQYNVARAKQLLAEAGYPDGIDPKTGERLTIYFDNTGTTAAGRQLVGLVQKQIEAIGIHLESRAWRDIVWQDRIDKGEFQFMTYGWLADYPDPENFVFLLYGPNKRPGPNACNYDNPEYNRLFEQMRSMEDGPAREAIIRKMRDIAVEDCPWIYLTHEEDLDISYDWFRNVKPHGVANDTVKYRRVDSTERVARQLAWNRPVYWPAAVILVLLILGSIPAANVVKQRTNRKLRSEAPTPGPAANGKQVR